MRSVASLKKARRPADRAAVLLRKAIQPVVRFLEDTQEGIAFLTMSGRVVWCNSSFGKLVGLAAKSADSKDIREIFVGLSLPEIEKLLAPDPRVVQEWQTVLRSP